MATGKSHKQKQQPSAVQSIPQTRSQPPAAPTQQLPSATTAKKSKKKKGKGKEPDPSAISVTQTNSNALDDDLYDDMPGLEEPQSPAPPRTGLSPMLESVHVTATTISRSGNGIATHLQTELLRPTNAYVNPADTLLNGQTGTKRSQSIPQSPLPKATATNGPGIVDEEYWSSFPPHIKNFAQTMYNIAQQMVQSDTYLKSGTATATATTVMKGMPGYPSGTYPPLPFDPSIFSDPAFTLSVEQAAAAALGVASPPPGQPPRGPLPQTNVVLLNEFGDGEHKQGGDEYCSEDEVDGGNFEDDDLDAFDLHPHPARPSALPSVPASLPDPAAQVILSYGEHVARAAAHPTLVASESVPATVAIGETPEHIGGDESAGLKGKKKKKHSKEGTDAPAEAPVAAVPNAAARGETRSADSAPGSTPEKDGRRPTGGVEATLRHPLSANAMPARKENLSANPPPSSRAQGKQPMAYAPTSTAAATTTTTNGQQTARTARAASKAPMPAHNYNHSHHHPSPPSSNASAPNKSRTAAPSGSNKNPPSNNKIWSTSSTEERERIKEFWLGLGEDERRNLVKIEKDTVLKKMKEQQKHNCSCAVCGRKRHAIEEELEVLYDAYYEELERYANYQQRYVSSGGTIPPPPGPGPFPGSVELDKNGAVIGHPQTKPPRNPSRTNRTTPITNGRKPPKPESEFDDDDGDEDDYEDDEEYDDDDEEEEEEEEDGAEEEEEEIKPRDRRNAGARGRRPVNGTKPNGRELFNLGSSLTVTGPNNILTVADDLLKNDGQKFLEMMEQLAERRMQREEEAAGDMEDDSEEDEEDEEDEDDEEEDEDEDEDDEEVMTEEQKMEEGKRMFSIFAARMFEQRVLQAYREKVAQERQQQLLRELEAEDQLTKEREAKKQSQNQKKKDKRRQQKQAKEEERATKAAEKAAEEAALKAKQLAHEEEQRKKREEERGRREAARKAVEEEKQRKEEERRKRVAEEREREAERERKRKEKEEKAKREREERERKAREEREAKAAVERAAREAAKREQQEKEERERKLAKEREEKAEKERAAQQQQQRAAAKHGRQPTSPRASGSAQRSQSSNGAAKKILTKPTPAPSPAPIPIPASTASSNGSRSQPQRPVTSTSQPSTPVAPSTQGQFSLPPAPLYPAAPRMLPPGANATPPRLPFAAAPPPFGVFGGPPIPQPPLGPSNLPRTFASPSPFDPPFNRGHTSAPIATPSKPAQNPLASPTLLAPGSSRRQSMPEPGPGPVARPIAIAPLTSPGAISPPGPIAPLAPIAPPTPIAPPAPIARPTGEPSGSGSGSPVRRSPSPKVLGSSALAADDDEVVPPPGRRAPPGVVGQTWGSNSASPRNVMGEARGPWGHPAPPAFPTRPPLGASLWGGMSPNSEWQTPATSFLQNSFINSSPSSHSGNRHSLNNQCSNTP